VKDAMTDRNSLGRACLHELAAQHRLPDHQPMDQMTLGWITDNRPANFDAAPSFPRPGLMLVPARSWFANQRQADSNHGVRSEQAALDGAGHQHALTTARQSLTRGSRRPLVDTDLDDAHTDHTHPRTRPVAAGCTESEDDWRRRLQHDTPGGHLLAHNAMTQTLTSGRPLHLMHTTTALDAIRASGHLYASSGCLLAALYCAPLTETPAGLRPHNLGAYLLQTKPHTQTLMIEIRPTTPAPAKGIDYLRLGPLHLRTYLDDRSFLTEAEDPRSSPLTRGPSASCAPSTRRASSRPCARGCAARRSGWSAPTSGATPTTTFRTTSK
jgi:hypothetical protein